MCIKQGLTYDGEGWCDQNLIMISTIFKRCVNYSFVLKEQNVILFLPL